MKKETRKRTKQKPKVFVGMSGGVDSSVSAALLKKAGYEVIGVFIRVWEPFANAQDLRPAGFCSWRGERREARRVAAHLDIPLLTLDLSREYKKRVVDYFIAEYKAGRTPNPDVMCNKHIKFGVFYDWAMQNKADFVATGHYSRRCEYTNNSNDTNKKTKASTHSLHSHEFVDSYRNCQLCVSTDNNKDQTYFLWNLKTEQLPHILFPIGSYTKPQVRALAKKFNLPNSEKKDSQGLCFVGQIDFKDFLKRELAEKPGDVLNEKGEIIGKHGGSIFFTLGERHGFEIFTKTTNNKPYYIIAKDTDKNSLTVSQNPHTITAERIEVKIEKTNWISKMGPETKSREEAFPRLRLGHQFLARVRYRQPLQRCQLTQIDPKKETAAITFEKPQLATPGQSLVLYFGNVCLGGGIIA